MRISRKPKTVGLRSRSGFTLVELLVAIAIIGILVGLSIPAIQVVRESARRTNCSNNLRQVAHATQNFESVFRRLPSGVTGIDAQPYRSMSWLVQVLPYVEQGNLWDRAIRDHTNEPANYFSHLGMRTVVPTYQCPSDPESGKVHWTHFGRLVASTNYLGSNGTNYLNEDGVLFRDSKIRIADITDGTSNTLLAGERPPSPDFWYGWWYAAYGQAGTGSLDMTLGALEINSPQPYTTYLEAYPEGPYSFAKGRRGDMQSTLHYWSYHPGGAHFAFCDGSIRFLSYEAAYVLPALATRAGGEIVNEE